MSSKAVKLLPLIGALGGGLPAVAIRLRLFGFGQTLDTLVYAVGIAAAAFVVSWAVELLRMDIGGALAIAALAIVTVAPEYAVEAVYAWKAGDDPSQYASLALANVTGSNRLLIGVGWPVLVFFAGLRKTRAHSVASRELEPGTITLPRQRSAEIAFLGLASVYTLTLPLRSRLSAADALILISLYVAYIARIWGADAEEPELVGPSGVISRLSPGPRRGVLAALFAFAGGVLLASAEPFAEGVTALGQGIGLSRFSAVRWLAPLASESPELILAVVLGLRLEAPTALAALLSTKLNQWTLLVGSIPVLFAASRGALQGLPLDAVQRTALFVTASQSLFGLSLLVDRSLSWKGAIALLALLSIDLLVTTLVPEWQRTVARLGLAAVYLAFAVTLLVRRRASLAELAGAGLKRRR